MHKENQPIYRHHENKKMVKEKAQNGQPEKELLRREEFAEAF